MKVTIWRTALSWILAIFFIVGGLTNIFASDAILADYQVWGYPNWFHYLTGSLELATAALLVFPATRFAGSILGATVMGAAAVTLLMHNDYVHALLPLAILGLTVLNARMTRSGRGEVSASE